MLANGDPRKDPEAFAPGLGWRCGYYGKLREIYDARSAALHGGLTSFTHRDANGVEFTIHHVLQRLLTWVMANDATELRALDREIAGLKMAPRPATLLG